MPDTNKWMESLTPETPLPEAATDVLTHRFDAVETWLERATDDGYDDPVKAIHQLRVSTRRAGSALATFGDALPDKAVRKASNALKKLRRAAGAARDADVHSTLFTDLADGELSEDESAARDAVLKALHKEGRAARENLREVVEAVTVEKVRKRRDALVKAIRKGSLPDDVTLLDAARDALPSLISEVRDCAHSHNGESAKLHQLRIACKQLRYATEIFSACLGDRFASDLYPRLKETQDHLGAMNDAHLARLRLERTLLDLAGEGDRADRDEGDRAVERGVRSLICRYAESEERTRVEFLRWWESVHGEDFLAPFERLLPARKKRLNGTLNGHAQAAARSKGVASAPARTEEPEVEPPAPARFGSRRLAAIDVGTNSIRVIVAEAFADGQYRVLDDEKEIARLGSGMTEANRIEDAAVERAVLAIDRQKRIAEGYGASYIRAVGTAAVRDAANGQELVDRVLERTGVRIEVISPEEEAQLTFRSVSAAFDLTSFPSVIADIGGGSAEVVLCSGGLIEQVFPVPLGAVRLTEKFGGPEQSAGPRFDEMREHIKECFDDYFRDAAIHPELLIGAGGTFEALAKLSMGRFGVTPGALIRGYDMQRDEVKRLLERLRGLTSKERAKLPGISPNRAEIIVAGAALVLSLMKRLRIERLRVHDGGIRDGLLLTMVQEMFPQDTGAGAAEDPKDPMRSVRQFSQVCNYERRHCAHVSRLSLQLFDQLVRDQGLLFDGWDTDRVRILFHAAALLHDVGYHIDYKKHHLHSYHLILHSGLRGFTRQEVEIIAQVARYHRKGVPKIKHKPFAKLPLQDRELVRTLSAILRVADGLDRTHMRLVKSIALTVNAEGAALDLTADSDPSVDVWGAERKADLWLKVFGMRPEFRWNGRPASSVHHPEPAEHAAERA